MPQMIPELVRFPAKLPGKYSSSVYGFGGRDEGLLGALDVVVASHI